MTEPFYAVIIPLSGRPDQGLPGPQPQPPGIWPGPGYPDQGLPGRPPHVGNRPPGSWDRPEYPSTGPVRPGRPIDPGYGVEEGGGTAGQLPIWPLDPAHPIAPPIPGEPELPPVDPPPGTIWPPLPPSVPAGKALAYVGITGVGYRYVVIDIPENPPELPPRPQPK
jgi:hypothetical protein